MISTIAIGAIVAGPWLASARASDGWPSLRLAGSAQVAFRVAHEWDPGFLDFGSRSAGQFVAAYLPSQRAGWVHLRETAGGAHETAAAPFGSVPSQLSFKPGHTYFVDIIVDRPATVAFRIPGMVIGRVQPRTFRTGFQTLVAPVEDGKVVLTETQDRIGSSDVSVVALAANHRPDQAGRAWIGSACSAALPAGPCNPRNSVSGGSAANPYNVDVDGSAYVGHHPGPYLDASYELLDGPPVTSALLFAFGLYLQ